MNFIKLSLLLNIFTACQMQPSATANTNAVPLPAKDSIPPAVVVPAVPPTVPTIYLTFDDGPLYGSDFVNALSQKEQVKFSVFVVGKHAQGAALSKMLDAYRNNPLIEVCNHSWSHANSKYKLFYSNPTNATQDIVDNEARLNLSTRMVRLPGRNVWRTHNIQKQTHEPAFKTAQNLYDQGFQVYGWDYEWERNGSGAPIHTPQQVVAHIESLFARKRTAAPNQLVLLGHDQMFVSKKAQKDFEYIIQTLKKKGYAFEFIGKYVDTAPPAPKPAPQDTLKDTLSVPVEKQK